MDEFLAHFHRRTVLSVFAFLLIVFLIPFLFFEGINFGNSGDGAGVIFGNSNDLAKTEQMMAAILMSFFELVPLVLVLVGERPHWSILALCIGFGYAPDFLTNYLSVSATAPVWVGHEKQVVSPLLVVSSRIIASLLMTLMEPLIALDLGLLAKVLYQLKPFGWQLESLQPTEHPGLPKTASPSGPGFLSRLSGLVNSAVAKFQEMRQGAVPRKPEQTEQQPSYVRGRRQRPGNTSLEELRLPGVDSEKDFSIPLVS